MLCGESAKLGTNRVKAMEDARQEIVPGYLDFYPAVPGIDPAALRHHLAEFISVDDPDQVAPGIPAFVLNPEIKVFNQKCRQRRNVAFFGPENCAGYTYSRQTAPRQTPAPWMTELMSCVNGHLGTNFNAILINQYETGRDYISDHADSGVGLAPGSWVAGLSFGQTRTFVIKEKGTKKTRCRLELPDGSLVVMKHQKKYTHGIPAQKSRRGERISITFREHVPTV